MNKLGFGILFTIGMVVVGFFIGGYLGDTLWFMANDYLPKCGELEDVKQNKCFNENRDYHAINLIFLFGGLLFSL